jgi:hypothetical protein
MVAETFQLQINIVGNLTIFAPKAPPSTSCHPLSDIIKKQTENKDQYDIFRILL